MRDGLVDNIRWIALINEDVSKGVYLLAFKQNFEGPTLSNLDLYGASYALCKKI